MTNSSTMGLSKGQTFEAWCYYYMIKYLKHSFAPFHKEWFDLVFKHDRLAVAAPRRFAKTHILSIFYSLFTALEIPGSNIILVSATVGFAIERILSKIKAELESNQQLIQDYGDQRSDRWSSERIVLKNGSIIEAKGAGGQIRGIGTSLIVVDDIEEDEAVESEDQRKKMDNWFWRALIGTLEPGARVIVVGTLLHPLSFLTVLIESGRKGWMCRKYVASDFPITKSNWPQRWPVEALQRMADERGIPAYKSELLNEPIPEEWRTFKRDELCYYEELPKGLSHTMTIDPAATVKNRSDYTAIIVVGTDVEGTSYVVDYIRERLTPDAILNSLFKLYEKYTPHTIGIETVGFQQLLKYIFELECRKRKIYPNIQELKLDVSDKGRNKRFRIESLQPWFAKKRLFISPKQKELESELIAFPIGKHDDLIDALASQLEIIAPAQKARTPDLPVNTFLGHLLDVKKVSRRRRKITPWRSRHAEVI